MTRTSLVFGQGVLQLPSRTTEIGWYLQYLATPKTRRPWVRAYTIRDARPDVGEVDIDFVIHTGLDGAVGPAAQFALDARPGERLGFLGQGTAYTPDHPHDWTLLTGDETALPAIAGICRSLPDHATGTVHAHAIGESGLATGARRHLVQERGVSKRHVDFVGYWRHGWPATS